MEGNPQGGGGGGGGGDVAGTHVKTEAVDENTSAPVLSSQDPPAPCGDPACRGGEEGGGGGGGADQTAEELQAAATTTPVLLYSVSADRFFASGDGKSYLKIAPAAAMPSAPSEKMLPSGSDFSSKAVLCLIEAVGRRWGLYETRERSQLFQSVQEEMAAKGHVLPVEKIRRKWNNLIVTYKRVKDRSRETGHAKTSWEFFDLMDATLCDTVGTQIINNKRPKGGHAVSSQPGSSAKSSMKPQVSHPPNIIRPNGDFAPASVVESAGLGPSVTICSAANSGSTVAISTSDAPEVKPLLVLSSDTVTTSIHGATIVPSSLISSPCFTEAVSTSPPLGSVSTAELNASRYVSRKAPSFSPGVIPFRLGNTQSLIGVPSSFPSTCPSFSVSTSSPAITTAGAEGQGQKRNEPQASAELLQEVLKRQEEQAYLDRVARRRLEARERRRERREVRMAESLGRIATALELLSSKQDTVIALLQRLADKK